MNKLILMMGPPGAGKSTWLKNNAEADAVIVSRDEIRFSLVSEEEEYFARENDVFEIFIDSIVEALTDGFDVYADATHLTPQSRLKVLRAVTNKLGYPVPARVIYVKREETVCLEQNELRKGTRAYVPRGVIRRMAEALVEPCYKEGEFYYDGIGIV